MYAYRGQVFFIEYKAENAPLKFSPLQQVQRDRLASAGLAVFLVNNIESGCLLIDKFMERAEHLYEQGFM